MSCKLSLAHTDRFRASDGEGLHPDMRGVIGSAWPNAMDIDKFLSFMRELQGKGVDYFLVGGVALNLHGILRATEDIDLFIRPEAENVDQLKQSLRAVWDDPDIDTITVADLAGDYPVIRYGSPDGDMVIDIMARLGDTFRFEDLEAETVLVEGVSVRIATPRTLYRMKKDTVRPMDKADAVALQEKFNLTGE